jgi:4a-hydroxytetrahydrobiopterin dehydratase
MERRLLSEEEINTGLSDLAEWSVSDNRLVRRFTFANFAESLAFVNRVGQIAEAADHHPDITFGWGYAEISTTTHDRGGVTDVDIALARQIDGL